MSAYLQLIRPRNTLTAVADVWAGYLLSLPAGHNPAWLTLVKCSLASACLYSSGMVFNDVADADRDAALHPERPLPDGRASMTGAFALAFLLMVAGMLAAQSAGFAAGAAGALIAVFIVGYDFITKRWPVAGSANMGLLRALNMCLGMAAAWEFRPGTGSLRYPAMLFVYIFLVTLLSTFEDEKNPRAAVSMVLLALAAGCAGAIFIAPPSLVTTALLALMAAIFLVSGLAAVKSYRPLLTRSMVAVGVLCVIVLDAAFVATSGRLIWTAVLLLFLVPAVLRME
jgi:hypothetical protein